MVFSLATSLNFVSALSASASEVNPGEPNLYWTFDSPTQFSKEEKSGVVLTVHGSASHSISGISNGSLQLNSATSDFLSAADGSLSELPIGNSPYTISAWINTTNCDRGGITYWGDPAGWDAVTALRVSGPAGTGSCGFVDYWFRDDNETPNLGTSIPGSWHFVTSTYDGTLKKIYVNGILQHQVTTSAPQNSTNTSFQIGQGWPAAGDEYFTGRIDDLSIFRRALSQGEINYLKNRGVKESIRFSSLDENLQFQSVELGAGEFTNPSSRSISYHPFGSESSQDESQDGSVIVLGNNWGPLYISRDGGANFVRTEAAGYYPEQIDWKQISISPDGQRIVASSARGNTGGFIFTSTDAGVTFKRIDRLGNANWTGASIGADTNNILVLDGVGTIWGNAASGTGCDTEYCSGSGFEGSNLDSGETPLALAYYSSDFGATWSAPIAIPAGSAGVTYALNSGAENFYLRVTDGASSIYKLSGFAALRSSPTSNSSKSEQELESEARAAREKAIQKARILLREKISTSTRLDLSDFISADISGINSKNVSGVNLDFDQLKNEEKSFANLLAIAHKYEIVGRVEERSGNLYSKDLIQVGLMESSNPYKTLIVRSLKRYTGEPLNSFSKISTFIAGELANYEERRERLRLRILKNSNL